jgi:SOS response regulatory protein OraA/RecX
MERAAVPPAARAESLDVLARAGILDDDRFARTRAEALAGRGYGDAAIQHDLEGQGIAAEAISAALAGLEAEAERARRVLARRGTGSRTARYLAAKGFGEEAVEAASGADFANDP